jgi:choline dehydrogenase-like flavoprotein
MACIEMGITKPWVGLQWMLFHKGPAATNHFEGGGFIRSNETVAYPNLQFHFLPVAIRYDGQFSIRGAWLPGACWPNEF